MKCPHCNKEILYENVKFCPNCGQPLNESKANIDENTDIIQNNNKISGVPKKHKIKKLYIALIAIVLILAALGLNYKSILYGIDIYKCKLSKSNDEKIEYCIKAMKLKKTKESTDILLKLLENEININTENANNYISAFSNEINKENYNKLMIDLCLKEESKAEKNNLKDALDKFIEAKRYGYKLASNSKFKNILDKYVDLTLVKKSKLDIFSSDDIDDDGYYEIFGFQYSISGYDISGSKDDKIIAYRYNEKGLQQIDEKIMDEFGCESINIGKVYKNEKGIYVVTCEEDETNFFNLLLFKNNKLSWVDLNYNPFMESCCQDFKVKDIDKDGVLEVGSFDENDSFNYYKWDGGTGFKFVKKEKADW